MKNGIFIIESIYIVTFGAFFFLKFNDSTKEIEILSEVKDRKIQFITEYSNGNFAYNYYIHRPVFYEDAFFIYDINKNEKHILHHYSDYDGIFSSNFAIFTNGFAFTNSMCFNENNKHRYLNIVEGFDFQKYTIDLIGYIEKLIYEDKYLYILNYDKKVDSTVYIFNIDEKKFYPNFIKISYEKKIQKKKIYINKKKISHMNKKKIIYMNKKKIIYMKMKKIIYKKKKKIIHKKKIHMKTKIHKKKKEMYYNIKIYKLIII